MIKGRMMLRINKARRYSDMFKAWVDSRHDVLIVRCGDDDDLLRKVKHAAIRFRENNDLQGRMSISKYGQSIYLMKIEEQDHAMEAFPYEDGWVLYYEKGEYDK